MTRAGVWRHFRGGLYRVLFNAKNSTNGPNEGEQMIVYISLTTGKYHAREERQFHAFVYKENGIQITDPLRLADMIGDAEFERRVALRFEYVGDDLPLPGRTK